jgi:arylsulfatase
MPSRNTTRRGFLGGLAAASTLSAGSRADGQAPNIVVIYLDDLGYGDLGCYGSCMRTPNIDGMASEGVTFRQFYSAAPVCSPARAALLTGRYPARTGVRRVLMPFDDFGLTSPEVTIPQVLRQASYRSMCVGKWHLGSVPSCAPTARGFDEFFGIPYSTDMSPLPLMHNADVLNPDISNGVNLLTQQFTQAAVQFIQSAASSPFFLYLAYSAPHLPLGTSPQFRARSALGPYGDMVEEVDWGVGQVFNALRANGIDNNTLVIFSSDHGPWYQGNTGGLRGRKGETWEGGMKVPMIARLPGRIPSGLVTQSMATTMDLLPTLAGLSGVALPPNPVDGVDIWPLMTGSGEIRRDIFLYFDTRHLQGARLGRWKLHVSRYNSFAWTPDPPGGRLNLPLPRPELYDVVADPSESCDVASYYPDVVADIKSRMQAALPTFPDIINSAWQETFSRQVYPTPSGALPALP